MHKMKALFQPLSLKSVRQPIYFLDLDELNKTAKTTILLPQKSGNRQAQPFLPSHPAPPPLYNYLQYLFIRQQLCSIWTLLLARKVLCPPSNGVYNWSPLFTAPCRLINWRFVAVEMSAWNIPCRTQWTWKCTKRQRRIPADFTFWCDGIPHSYCYVVFLLHAERTARAEHFNHQNSESQ